VELRGLEPLASCMPCLTNPSGMVRDGQVRAGQSRFAVWPRTEPTGVGWARSHLVCHWLSGLTTGGEAACPPRSTKMIPPCQAAVWGLPTSSQAPWMVTDRPGDAGVVSDGNAPEAAKCLAILGR
jgi:hypothetical protein